MNTILENRKTLNKVLSDLHNGIAKDFVDNRQDISENRINDAIEFISAVYSDNLLTKTGSYNYHDESVIVWIIEKIDEYKFFINEYYPLRYNLDISRVIRHRLPQRLIICQSKNNFFYKLEN